MPDELATIEQPPIAEEGSQPQTASEPQPPVPPEGMTDHAAGGQAPPPSPPPTVEEAEPDGEANAVEAAKAEIAAENKKRWYVVKVQSGREESIKETIERR